MMMPANYSAIAANEMTYVGGGAIVDYLVPTLNESNWKTFNTNLVKIIGNSFTDEFVKGTLGVIFNGHYAPGDVTIGTYGKLKTIFGQSYGFDSTDTWGKITSGAAGVLNVGLNIVGNAAAIYNLGFGKVENLAGKAWSVKGQL